MVAAIEHNYALKKGHSFREDDIGNMAELMHFGPAQKGKPGYEGFLNNRVACVASVMRDAGYHTYMAGAP